MSKTKLNSLKKKRSSLTKIDDKDSKEQTMDVTSIYSKEQIKIPEEDINIVSIPNDLHEYFKCVVGKHLFIDKPWTKISHKKIIDNLQSHKSNSCFWRFRKKLGGIKNEYVLVGYTPFRNTDEEFIICTTDRANLYIEESRAQVERELKQKVERTICRVPGQWESKNSEKDIEEVKPVQTRDKITYIWKIPTEKDVKGKVEFEGSNTKSTKNEYVKLEPQPKETFKKENILIMDSSTQAVGEMVNEEIQTIQKINETKCIQSVAIEEEMFQLQSLTDSNKALDEFLEKHVPNLVKQLHYNELYDLYRDDYKLLKNDNEKPFDQNVSVIKFLPGYQNVVNNKRYVSCQTWHPTIPGVFAVSYMSNSNALYKSVSLETPAEDITKPTVKDKKYEIVSNDDEKSPESWNNHPNLVDENYNEKIISLLNKEFVQRMRIIEVTDSEKLNEQYSHDIITELRKSVNDAIDSNSAQQKQHKKNNNIIQNEYLLEELVDETLFDENVNEAYNGLMYGDNVEEWSELNYLDNEFSTEEKEHEMQIKENKEAEHITNSFTSINAGDTEKNGEVDHHDSDTESFYNIWGDDEDWLYGNKLRIAVRHIHREFNKKYDRQAREEKFLTYLKSEKTYPEKKNKDVDMEEERIKLVQDMFKAGDMCKRYSVKSQIKLKSKNKIKHTVQQKNKYKALQNEEESMIKRENMPLVEENNNLVIIWSISDNIFPQLRLESPEEVCCVEFNPRNGDIIVGGLTNGQICIWDIKGKLDRVDSNDSNLSEKEKMHYKHLRTLMNWSLDVNFKTKIRPAALSAILESHDLMVTAIQWIHPMNEITPRGRFTTVEDHFSIQFFSASIDGTVKLWDLHSMPLQKLKEKHKPDTRFGRPKNLENYESPLKVYNNRLKPSYTIVITDPESDTCSSPITAMSFEIPLMRYNYTSHEPFVIGKRQFEFVPSTPNETNHLLVVGNIMGQIGVVTWDGYGAEEECRNKEDCKHIWWGHVHDGPISCIKRNVFFPDIHLVCGGHVVSMWSLDYKGCPIWWKRFDDFTNSVLWSTVHPAKFQVSFNTTGVLQFWDFMKCTHQPYYTSDIFIGDGLIATLSTPQPPIHYSGAERFTFADGINEVMNHEKFELISFSDFTGTIIMIAIDATALKSNEIEEVRCMFQNEVDRRKELDEWNNKYKEQLETLGDDYHNVDDDYNTKGDEVAVLGSTSAKNELLYLTEEKIMRDICNTHFKWYLDRKGPETRSARMREEYLEKEARYRVEFMMKKKNVSKKQLEECLRGTVVKDDNNDEITKIRLEADETYKDVMKKLLAAEQNKEYVFEFDSKRSCDPPDMKKIFEEIHRFLITDFAAEKEKFRNYIKNNPYKAKEQDWGRVIENAKEDVQNYLIDENCFKVENLRKARQRWSQKYINDNKKLTRHEVRDRYKMRGRKIKVVHEEASEGDYEQLYDSFDEESGEGSHYFSENSSSIETIVTSTSYSDRFEREQSVVKEDMSTEFEHDD